MGIKSLYILGILLYSITLILFSITFISASDITFFYSEDCPYCQDIKPFIMEFVNAGIGHWNIYETSHPYNQEAFKSHGFRGVPAFVIQTDDDRIIKFTGADRTKLGCELLEMSIPECKTKTATTCMTGSVFEK